MGSKLGVSHGPTSRPEYFSLDSLDDELEYGILSLQDDDILDLSFLEDSEVEYQWGDSDLDIEINSVDGNLTNHAHGSYEDRGY
ncbi:MAG: hypothetical protein ACC707_14030 [Thiohalomonadales bacterium]